MPNMSKQYQLMLGTFIDDEFVWHDVDSYSDLKTAYAGFKKYVNSQLKYTDEELIKVWNTGRLDVELRRGNRLLNWVGIYAREVDKLSKEGEDKADKENPEKQEVKDERVHDAPPIAFTRQQYRTVVEGLREQKTDPSITNADIARAAGVSTLVVERIRFHWQFIPENKIPFVKESEDIPSPDWHRARREREELAEAVKAEAKLDKNKTRVGRKFGLTLSQVNHILGKQEAEDSVGAGDALSYSERKALERKKFFRAIGKEDDGRLNAELTRSEFEDFEKQHEVVEGSAPRGDETVLVYYKYAPYEDISYFYNFADGKLYEVTYHVGD